MVISVKSGEVRLEHQGKKKKIFEKINFTVNSGKFISIVGHSGCGKTTLLRTIAGLQELSSGEILYDKSKLPIIGWVPQFPVLIPNKTVFENVIFPLRIHGVHDFEYARKLIRKYGLSNCVNYYPKQISGGMKQKVSIIRALVTRPNILLMDEPFASIDQYTREILNIDLANKLREEKITTILVTHSIEEAIFLSDEVFIMKPTIPSTILKKTKILLPINRSVSIKNSNVYLKNVSTLRKILFSLSKKYYGSEYQ